MKSHTVMVKSKQSGEKSHKKNIQNTMINKAMSKIACLFKLRKACIFEKVNECKPCPVCGKLPKAYYIWAKGGKYAGIKIVCKPFLRKAHCSHFSVKRTITDAYYSAIESWNKEAENPEEYKQHWERMNWLYRKEEYDVD